MRRRTCSRRSSADDGILYGRIPEGRRFFPADRRLDQTTVTTRLGRRDAYESGADFDGVVQAVKDSFAQASSVPG